MSAKKLEPTRKFKDEIGDLAGLDHDVLKQRWVDLYRIPHPSHISRKLLIQAIAYQIQVKAFGGLSRSAQAKLRGATSRKESAGKRRPARPVMQHRFRPGTHLIREWRGQIHEVTVADDGTFIHHGMTHGSLSSIARAITGTRWSGPAFFGLRTRMEAKRDGKA